MIRLQFCSAFLIREELLFYQLDCYSWVELNNFQSIWINIDLLAQKCQRFFDTFVTNFVFESE